MKTTKRILACLMILAMLAAMLCVGASAVNITITNGEGTYNAYKVLDLEKNDTTDAFLYIVTDTGATTEWYDFIKDEPAAQAFLKATQKSGDVYYVEQVVGADESEAIAFANAAYDYAVANPSEFIPVSGTTSLTLEDGFYVMKSSAGTTAYAFTVIRGQLAGVDGNYSGTTIKSKSSLPSITKTVNNAVAAQGESLEYTIVVEAKKGAQNYIIRDNADAGITVDTSGFNTIAWNDGGTLKTLNKGTDYTVATTGIDGCDFEIKFTESACNALDTNDTLTITYTGSLNGSAVMGGNGNGNTATLYYGIDSDSNGLPDISKDDSAYVHTFEIIINKTYAGGGTPDGAVFTLYKHDGSDFAVVGTFTEPTANTVFSYKGLAEGKYKISETAVPEGYVKADDVEFVVTATADSTAPAEFTDLSAAGFTANKADGRLSIELENKTGSLLPETGGIGTTVFYAVGGLLVLGAVVILLMKKRSVTE